MTRIALISDNHSHNGEDIMEYLDEVDEVWHAGDIGSRESIKHIKEIKPFRAVYGNIDTPEIRQEFPLNQIWKCESVKVLMTHIGGYPGRYTRRVKELLIEHQPKLYICGHSHICKVQYDPTLQVLHMNPGSYGYVGWHKVRTLLRFTIDGEEIKELEVVELGNRWKSK
ncbi:MAG: metallophosphoesterase family protein [Saprospiraceae bacterium]|nr:metallophosphoesterase family protein [Saprospiraceae bacterium]